MYCNRCNAYIPDNAEFCPQCGARQNAARSGASGSKNGIIIGAIVAVAVVLVVGIICFTVIWKGNQETQLAQQTVQTEQTQQPEDTAGDTQRTDSDASNTDDADTDNSAGASQAQQPEETERTTSVTNNYYYYGAGAVRDNDYYTQSVSSGYLWPTDTQYISSSDLRGLSEDTVAAIRNEIYARHGYAFTTAHWQNYFAAKTWYHRDSSCTENTINRRLSGVERTNIDTIVAYEESQGWR
ncbi:MAG: YARHG domain-containing protein [Eubacteriales bacterium]|nr:YARHG domain-containing protein [Eubacteriales bacterium]